MDVQTPSPSILWSCIPLAVLALLVHLLCHSPTAFTHLEDTSISDFLTRQRTWQIQATTAKPSAPPGGSIERPGQAAKIAETAG